MLVHKFIHLEQILLCNAIYSLLYITKEIIYIIKKDLRRFRKIKIP